MLLAPKHLATFRCRSCVSMGLCQLQLSDTQRVRHRERQTMSPLSASGHLLRVNQRRHRPPGPQGLGHPDQPTARGWGTMLRAQKREGGQGSPDSCSTSQGGTLLASRVISKGNFHTKFSVSTCPVSDTHLFQDCNNPLLKKQGNVKGFFHT